MEQHKDNKIVFKQIEVEGDTVVATDKDNNVFYKLKFSNDIKGRILDNYLLISSLREIMEFDNMNFNVIIIQIIY